VTDRYTRAVLTVIAATLVVSTVQRMVTPADAQFGPCGNSASTPCTVMLVGWDDYHGRPAGPCNQKFPCIAVKSVP